MEEKKRGIEMNSLFLVKDRWKIKEGILRAFLSEEILSEKEISDGFLTKNNYPYEIVFDSNEEGVLILENLPAKVLVSFQTFQGGIPRAVVRLFKERK